MRVEKGKKYRYTFEAVAQTDGDTETYSAGRLFNVSDRTNITVEEIKPPWPALAAGQFWGNSEGAVWVILPSKGSCMLVNSADGKDVGTTYPISKDSFSPESGNHPVDNPFVSTS